MGWTARVDDEARERELRRSWPRALGWAAVWAVICGAACALVALAIGTSWVAGASTGFFVGLLTVLATRVAALYEYRSDLLRR